jgi:hypothetical protein
VTEELGTAPKESISEQEKEARLLRFIDNMMLAEESGRGIDLDKAGKALEQAGFKEGDAWFALGREDNQFIALKEPVKMRYTKRAYFLLTSSGVKGILIEGSTKPYLEIPGTRVTRYSYGDLHGLEMEKRFVDSLKMIEEGEAKPEDFRYSTGVSQISGPYEWLGIPIGDTPFRLTNISLPFFIQQLKE